MRVLLAAALIMLGTAAPTAHEVIVYRDATPPKTPPVSAAERIVLSEA